MTKPSTLRSVLLPAALFLAAVLAFLPSLTAGFVHIDDPLYLLKNERVLRFDLFGLLTRPDEGQFNVLPAISFAIEHSLFGLDPKVYHSTNLLLHALNTLLVFRIFCALSRSQAAGWITALLFAVHPLHAEPVAWISSRKDLLYAFFGLASLGLYLRQLESGSARERAASFALFVLSAFSKPMAVSLPIVFYFAGRYRHPEKGRSPLALTPFFLVSAAVAALTIAVHPARMPGFAQPDDLFLRFVTVAYAPVFYLSKILWPADLSVIYSYRSLLEAVPWSFALAPVLVAVVGTIAVFLRKPFPALLFGLLIYLACLLPILPFRPFSFSPFGDRYAYLAVLGVFFPLGAALDGLKGAGRQIALAALLAVVLALTAVSWQQSKVWRDTESLMDQTLKIYPRLGFGYLKKGDLAFERGDLSRALVFYDQAVELALKAPSGHNTTLAAAYHNRGVLRWKMGQAGEARADVERAAAVDLLDETGARRTLEKMTLGQP